jgi:hypothetical protein
MFVQIVLMGELVTTEDLELFAVYSQTGARAEVLGSHVFLLIHLTRLIEGKLLMQLLSRIKKWPFEHEREGVSAVIGEVDLSDVDGVVGQVIVDNVGVIGHHVEKEYFTVVLQELFLGLDSATAQLVLEVIHHAGVFLRNVFIL